MMIPYNFCFCFFFLDLTYIIINFGDLCGNILDLSLNKLVYLLVCQSALAFCAKYLTRVCAQLGKYLSKSLSFLVESLLVKEVSNSAIKSSGMFSEIVEAAKFATRVLNYFRVGLTNAQNQKNVCK